MQKTKFLALFLVMAMLFSLSAVFPAMTVSAIAIPIYNVEPAILAEAGTAIELSDYSVELDDGTALSPNDIEWYNGTTAISTFTPSAAGVTALTAQKKADSSVKKTIYVVAKLSTDDEYVLYATDFNSTSDINDWRKSTSTSGVYTVSNGKLTINGLESDNPKIFLPSWLADFGNYKIETVGTQKEATDASRWFSMMYRIQNIDTTGNPFFHMCVRSNATAGGTGTTGGVECVYFTNKWEYVKSSSYTEAINSNKNYTFTVMAKDDVVQYQIDGNTVIHVENLPVIDNNIKGGVGLIANSSKFVIDSIKISIQEQTPERPPVPKPEIINVRQPETNTLNHITNIGIIQSKEEFDSYTEDNDAPANLIFYADGTSLTAKDGAEICEIDSLMENAESFTYLPAFYVKDTDTVDEIISEVKAADLKDVLFISDNPELVKYAREEYTLARGAVDFSELETMSLSANDLLMIRGVVNSALSLIAILPERLAYKEYISELQSNAITVWVKDENLDGEIEAAKLITSGATGIITDKFTAIETALKSLIKPNTMTKTPIIIGHRGNPSQAPENSISGYLTAIKNGADTVETDIHLSADNNVIVMHDATIDRTTNGSGSISSMTLAQIKQYTLKGSKDEKIPTFEELLQAIKPTKAKIFIEIKSGNTNIVKPMVDLIKEYDMESRVSVISFSEAQLKKTQELMPAMSTGFLLNAPAPSYFMEEALNSLYDRLLNIQSANATMNVNYGNISEFFVDAAVDRGITIWPWTYSKAGASAFNKHFLWGLDGLTTDDAQYSMNMVKSIKSSDKIIYLKDKDSTAYFAITANMYSRRAQDITFDSKTFIKVLEGENLISINNGVVTAEAAEGTASFMVGYSAKTEEGDTYVLYTQPITVRLGEEGGLNLTPSSKYSIDKYLAGVRDNTTLSSLLDNLESDEYIAVIDDEGKIVTDENQLIGTGYKVQIIADNIVYHEKPVIVLGDINSDGKISASDYLLIKRQVIGSMNLEGIFYQAALIRGKEKPEAVDCVVVKRYILGTMDMY